MRGKTMIRPLRQRHRFIVLALGVVVPVTFAFGVITRRKIPVNPSANELHATTSSWKQVWNRDDLWEKQTLHTRLLTNSALSPTLAIELSGGAPIVRPDLLLYWAQGTNRPSDSLPDNVFLLGSFNQSFPSPLALPAEAAGEPGVLILYSLPEQEIVAVSKPLN